MNRLILALMVIALATSACGIKRPLLRPDEIPAAEKRRADKMKKFEAPSAATSATTPKPAAPIIYKPDPQVLDMSGPTPVPGVPH